MQNTELKTIVEENKISIISLFQGEGVNRYEFTTESPDYMEQQNYGVEGPYRINLDTLYIDGSLEEPKEIEVPVRVMEDEPLIDNEIDNNKQKLEEAMNLPVTIVVFNRKDLTSAMQSTQVQHIPAFIKAVKESYEKNFGPFEANDFATIEIDFDNRSVLLKSLPE